MSTTVIPEIDEEPALLPAVQSASFLTAAALEDSLAEWGHQRAVITQYIRDNFKEGIDYYTLQVGGRTTRPTLGKPGAEKFLNLFRLSATFRKDEDTWEMLGRPAGVLCYVCALTTRSGELVGEGRGARDVKKDGGDINKAIKMAQKSAQVDAVLRTGALSDAYTQDLEDTTTTTPATLSPALMRDKLNEVLAELGYSAPKRREWWDALCARLEGEPTMRDLRHQLLYLEKRLRNRPESTNASQEVSETVQTEKVASAGSQTPFWRDILIAHAKNPKLPQSLRDRIAQVQADTYDSIGLELAGAVLDWVDQVDKGAA